MHYRFCIQKELGGYNDASQNNYLRLPLLVLSFPTYSLGNQHFERGGGKQRKEM